MSVRYPESHLTLLEEAFAQNDVATGDIIVEKEDDEFGIYISEGVAKFIDDHPYMSTAVAGYVLHKVASSARGNSSIDVVTNIMKFYARTPTEIKIQRALVADLIATKHYKLLGVSSSGGVTTWRIKRQSTNRGTK